jgi:hypothetical protein
MEIENLAYETPQLEVLEIELEQAVMSWSGEGGNESDL